MSVPDAVVVGSVVVVVVDLFVAGSVGVSQLDAEVHQSRMV